MLLGSGHSSPAGVTLARKPCFCSASMRSRCSFVKGMAVVPSRALDTFCRCEQTCARLTRDMACV